MKKIQVNKRIVKNPTSVVPQLQVAVVTNFKVTYSSLLLCILVYILIFVTLSKMRIILRIYFLLVHIT